MDRKDSAHKRGASKLSRSGNDSVIDNMNTLEGEALERKRPQVDPCLIMDDIIEKL